MSDAINWRYLQQRAEIYRQTIGMSKIKTRRRIEF
jgi:hypothetical protein